MVAQIFSGQPDGHVRPSQHRSQKSLAGLGVNFDMEPDETILRNVRNASGRHMRTVLYFFRRPGSSLPSSERVAHQTVEVAPIDCGCWCPRP